jgi:hypothetical protein
VQQVVRAFCWSPEQLAKLVCLQVTTMADANLHRASTTPVIVEMGIALRPMRLRTLYSQLTWALTRFTKCRQSRAAG